MRYLLILYVCAIGGYSLAQEQSALTKLALGLKPGVDSKEAISKLGPAKWCYFPEDTTDGKFPIRKGQVAVLVWDNPGYTPVSIAIEEDWRVRSINVGSIEIADKDRSRWYPDRRFLAEQGVRKALAADGGKAEETVPVPKYRSSVAPERFSREAKGRDNFFRRLFGTERLDSKPKKTILSDDRLDRNPIDSPVTSRARPITLSH